jgi:hypothetical protein
MSETLRINKIEVACELAHDRTQLELDIIDSSEMYEYETQECFIYKEHIQEHFNRWYDYYLTKLEELGQ